VDSKIQKSHNKKVYQLHGESGSVNIQVLDFHKKLFK
jgi:hypothetical protein